MVGVAVAGIGRGARLITPGAPRLVVGGRRVTYGYRSAQAWYQSGPLGIEQGFIVPRRLRATGTGPLAISLTVTGAVVVARGRGEVQFKRGRALALREGGLVARDAQGRLLRAWLSVSGGRLLIRVQDRGARYPLRIDPLIQSGTLAPSAGQSYLALGGVAVSGQTVAVGADATVGANQQQGAVYVFTESPQGWASGASVAVLTASDGHAEDQLGEADFLSPTSVAISGRTIVAAAPFAGPNPDPAQPTPGAVYVFEEPASGWSGSVQQSAELVASAASACRGLDSVAVSGGTVAAACKTPDKETRVASYGAVLVFTEPADGWSGTQTESAVLTAPAGQTIAYFSPLSIADNTIFAENFPIEIPSPERVYAFTAPSRGWTGTISPAATLRTPAGTTADEMVATDRQVFVATTAGTQSYVYVYRRPGSTWAGSVRWSARLSYFWEDNLDPPSLAVSGSTVSVGEADEYGGFGGEHECPCNSYLSVFQQPHRGWRGTLVPDSYTTLPTLARITLAEQDKNLFVTVGNQVDLLSARPTRPRMPTGSLTGLANDKPRLRFTVSTLGPKLVSATVALPPGLVFAKRHRQLVAAVTTRGTKVQTVTRAGDRLVVAFRRPTRKASVSIRPSALIESRRLLKRSNHSLRVAITVADLNRSQFKLSLRIPRPPH
jgi:FG-GAP repeat